MKKRKLQPLPFDVLATIRLAVRDAMDIADGTEHLARLRKAEAALTEAMK